MIITDPLEAHESLWRHLRGEHWFIDVVMIGCDADLRLIVIGTKSIKSLRLNPPRWFAKGTWFGVPVIYQRRLRTKDSGLFAKGGR